MMLHSAHYQPINCPIFVWMLVINREITREELDKCAQVLREISPQMRLPQNPDGTITRNTQLSELLPLMMMRYAPASRVDWRYRTFVDPLYEESKNWIEHLKVNEAGFVMPPMGYQVSSDNNLVGLAFSQGQVHEIVNLGLGVVQVKCPPNMRVVDYINSFAVMLSDFEYASLWDSHPQVSPAQREQDALRRLSVLRALKIAMKSIPGQQRALDSKLEFDVRGGRFVINEKSIPGWEFRLWQVNQGTQDKTECYQCACAFFRGGPYSTSFSTQNEEDMKSWISFMYVENLMNNLPNLLE